MKTRRAFTIVELMISVAVMLITYAAMAVSAQSAKQSAEHEAGRLAAYIFRTIQRADRMHNGFWMNTAPGYVHIKWNSGPTDVSFKATIGCRYTNNFKGNITYDVSKKLFTSGGTITVTNSQGEVYYVIIASATEGRIRLSPTDNPSNSEKPSK